MHTIYSFLTGPMAWIAFIVFFGGILYRLVSRGLLAKRKDAVFYEYWSFRHAIRSIAHWIVPFASTNSRNRPILSIVTFVFHLLLFIAPLFLFAHITLINEAFNVSWWFMPDGVADVLTVIVVGACLFFFVRRLTQNEVRYLTTMSDYVVLFMVALPFISGFWAYHQWAGYAFMTLLHIFSGEVLLMAIPFTKLSHMFFFPFTRGYIGSEFGAVRYAKDW
ncbi:MAG: TmcC family electron transfer complex membrane anchor subunit [Desulfobacterales bacterium]